MECSILLAGLRRRGRALGRKVGGFGRGGRLDRTVMSVSLLLISGDLGRKGGGEGQEGERGRGKGGGGDKES